MLDFDGEFLARFQWLGIVFPVNGNSGKTAEKRGLFPLLSFETAHQIAWHPTIYRRYQRTASAGRMSVVLKRPDED